MTDLARELTRTPFRECGECGDWVLPGQPCGCPEACPECGGLLWPGEDHVCEIAPWVAGAGA